MSYRYDAATKTLYGTPTVRPTEKAFKFGKSRKATTKAEAEEMYATYCSDAYRSTKRAFRAYVAQVETYIVLALAGQNTVTLSCPDWYTALALGEDTFALYGPPPQVVMASHFIDLL